MKTLVVGGIIGFDIYGAEVRKFLDDANGEELTVEIASPGGFVYDGLEIFNLIFDYSHNLKDSFGNVISAKKNNITFKIHGLAASMASFIALAGNKIIAEDNSVFMIHNVWSFAVGDYRDFQKEAKEIEALTNLIAKSYAKKSGKSINEIRKLMDEETYYYGDEAKTAGFVDEIIKTDNNDGKELTITSASGRIKNCLAKLKESKKAKSDLQRAASILPDLFDKPKAQELPVENKMGGKKKMTKEELKLQEPALYDELYNSGKTEGMSEERKRVSAHITMGQKSGATEKMFEFIKNGSMVSDQEVFAEYMSAGLNNKDIQARKEDEIKGQNTTGVDDLAINEVDTSKYVNSLLKMKGVKNVK